MPRLLYTWEFGDDMGHISVFLPIAKEMQKLGWEIILATPMVNRNAKNIETLINKNNFTHVNAPGSYGLTDSSEVFDHSELLASLGPFWDRNTLLFVLQSWLAIYQDMRPDIIIGDFSPVALLAAKIKNIPHFAIDLGFFYPDPDQDLPLFQNILGPILKNENNNTDGPEKIASHDNSRDSVLSIINSALNELNVEPLNSIREIYQADEIFLFNYHELSPLKHLDAGKFIGAVISENEGISFSWPSADETLPKVFAYLKADMAGVKAVMDSLRQDSTRNVVVYLSGGHEKIPERYASEHMYVSLKALAMDAVLAEADIIICHAGVGMITQSLLAGVPLLLLPTQSEQVLNANRVKELGAGLWLGYTSEINENDVQATLNRILSDVSFRVIARAFKLRNKPADLNRVTKTITDIYSYSKAAASVQPQDSGPVLMRRPRNVSFNDFDVIFLSFDEPNAEMNWEALKARVPHAKRVQNIKGFDSAHKAAAVASTTDRFILVDADNVVHPDFFDLKVEVPSHLEHSVWQWSSLNEPTGLFYPYGGVKIWTRDAALRMNTHENCKDKNSSLITDFSNLPYIHISYPVFSTNYTNGSPYQAFRSGFREVIKICGWAGVSNPADMEKYSNSSLLRRVSIWMSAGADVANGLWSMLGSRLALLRLFDADFDKNLVISYEWFDNYWREIFFEIATSDEIFQTGNGKKLGDFSNQALSAKVLELGHAVRKLVKKPPVLDMNPQQSFSFKQAMAQKQNKNAPMFGLFRTLDNF